MGNKGTTTELIDAVVDPGTWRSWDQPARQPGWVRASGSEPAGGDVRVRASGSEPAGGDVRVRASGSEPAGGDVRVRASGSEPAGGDVRSRTGAAYAATLDRARQRTGLDEAVITGEGRIRGRRVALLACEFAFLAGSIGVAAGERLVRAVERATRERLPLLASPSSGGTRLQEGAVAFLQMIKVTAAIADHKAAGLPYLVYLRHPTTGGVLASWGSLGHVTAAEPEALVGFLGPRVYEALHGAPFPTGVQVAENLYAHGLVDAVVAREHIADVVSRVLDVLAARDAHPRPREVPGEEVPDLPAAESIRRSRRTDRPGVRDLLDIAADAVTPLSGTGAGEREPGLVLALARFGDAPCLVVGQDRRGQRVQPLGPAGLREAQRGIQIATQIDLPLVTVIDTPGAALSKEAEEGGLAGEIARTLAQLVAAPAPVVCLLLGEGAGGAALALVPADRVVAAQHAWLSPLPPEGASAIIHRTAERADEMAEQLGIRALDLRAAGLVDRIVPERPDAAEEPDAFLRSVGAVLEQELAAVVRSDPQQRRSARHARFRSIGT